MKGNSSYLGLFFLFIALWIFMTMISNPEPVPLETIEITANLAVSEEKITGKREKSAVIEKSLAVRTRKILLKKNDYIEVWMFEDVIKNLMRHE